MLKELLIRYKLPMDKFWKKIQRFCISFALVVPTTTELAEYFKWLPEGTVPDWIKTVLGFILMVGILIPKFTVANNAQLNRDIKKENE